MNREVLFNRGLYAQYTKKHYLKAKQYYKNAILTKVKAKHAVESWLNKLITNREPLITPLKYLKKHKALWKNKPEEYKLIKNNIIKAYKGNCRKPESVFNLIEIYDIDRKKNMYKWEDTQLYIRRLLKYDPLILYVHTFYEMRGEVLQKNMRHYTTSRSGSRNPIYVAELAIDVTSCKISRAKNIAFYYDMVSANNVKVNNEDYYKWMKKTAPHFTMLSEDLYWSNQMIGRISTSIFKEIDFTVTGEEAETEVKVEKKKESVFEIETWKDFHFNSELNLH